MNRIHHLGMTLVVVLCALLAGSLPVRAANELETVKQRMELRLTDVIELKRTGRVGESNKGLLQILDPVSIAERRMIDEENRDRTTVYTAIARKAGGSSEDAGARRAKHIAASAERGTRIQIADGRWVTK